ncbi:MAG TPA: pre-peptidase C-terminal domain-containing protein [Phycisphaerae bacterium]|nr:pre-peptidase C-terminal domain-containing protein [Phycisphaerae bacterium]
MMIRPIHASVGVAVVSLALNVAHAEMPRESASTLSPSESVAVVSECELSNLTPSQRKFVEHLMQVPAAQRRGSFCVAPGTSQEYIDLLDRLMFAGVDDSQRYVHTTRWPGSQGSPFNLTYSFVPDGTAVPADSSLPGGSNQIHSLFGGLFGSTAAWQGIFSECFQSWGDLTGLSYTQVGDDGASLFGSAGSASRGDVRISSIPLDGFNGVLAYNQFPNAVFGTVGGGDMVLDANDGPNWANSANNYRFLRNTIMHEHGHGIGLMHVCPDNSSKLMEPAINLNFVGPQLDDVRSAQRHYGDVFEANDSVGSASDLGTFHNRTDVYEDLSIDDNSDVDVYAFTVPDNAVLDVSLTPVGNSYQSAEQVFFGCLFISPVTVNALSIHNLNMTLLDSNGSTTLITAANNSSGQGESINGYSLPGAGTYYLRVSASTSTDDIQLYDLSIEVGVPAGDGDADNDNDVDLIDYMVMQQCIGPVTAGCGALDTDADGDVDDGDLAGFVGALVGP